MIIGVFMIPQRFTKEKLPLDYRIERKNIDRRTRYFKVNEKNLVNIITVINVAEFCGMRIFKHEGIIKRVVAPDARTARRFYEMMSKGDFL